MIKIHYILLAMLALHPAPCSAREMKFNILDQCQDIVTIDKMLRRATPSSFDCRDPENELEKAIVSRAAPSSCLLMSAPFESATGFACLFERGARTSASISCFREFPIEEIETYKSRYQEDYAPDVANYLKHSASCSKTNHDATIAFPTLYNGVLLNIAKFEVGFAVGLGSTMPAKGVLTHGFATADPQLTGSESQGLEYIYGYVVEGSTVAPTPLTTENANRWRIVNIDDNATLNRQMNRMLRQNPMPVAVRMLGFDLTSGFMHAGELLDGKRQARGRELMVDAIADRLTDRDFDELDEDEFIDKFHVSYADWLDKLQAGIPYGTRARREALPPTFRSFFRPNDDCSASESGIVAIVMDLPAAVSEPGNYGSAAVLMIAAGNCLSDEQTTMARVVRELKTHVKTETED